MPEINESELKFRIKENPAGAYLLCGDETYLVKFYTQQLIKATVDESFAEFNLHTFECEDTDLSEIYDASLSIPMMAASKCVVVKDYPVKDASDKDFSALEELLKENPPDNCLIFTYPTQQPKPNEIKKLAGLFSAYGYVLKANKLTPAELVKVVEKGAKKRGKAFDKGVASYLVGNVGDDLNLLGNELEKVCAYAGEVIKKSDVDAVCVRSLDANAVFMVMDLARGSFEKAFLTLSKLFELREDEYMILGAVIAQYAFIYRAKAASSAGKSNGELIAAYESYKGREKRLNTAAQMAKNMSFAQITACMEILADADNQMKSTQNDKRQLLEETFVKLARVKNQ